MLKKAKRIPCAKDASAKIELKLENPLGRDSMFLVWNHGSFKKAAREQSMSATTESALPPGVYGFIGNPSPERRFKSSVRIKSLGIICRLANDFGRSSFWLGRGSRGLCLGPDET